MPTLLAITTLLLVAAITPGPNNIVMMRTGARRGVRGTLPAMTGVLLGGIAMLALTVTGAGVVFTRWPMLRLGVAIGGGLYLVWLGVHLLRAAGKEGEVKLPAGIIGLFVFQFFNPKGWVMLLTMAAVLPPGSALQTFARLAPLFVGISAGCLLLWGAAGHMLAMANPTTQRWIDRVLGVCLIASTLLLFH
ncbi:MAG: LysE family translocator [Dokdonella sp.]